MDKNTQSLFADTALHIPKVSYKEFTLDNGLHVILARRERIPSVAINTTFHVGAKDEEPGKSGLAHLFEHLLFEGTANTSNGEFDMLLQERGGESNAYTTMDITSYYTVVPSNQLEFGLWLDSDRLAGFGVTKHMLEVQKEVVLEEKMTVYDNVPYGSLEEESNKRLFPSSNYGKMIIGSADDIKSVTIDDVKSFWDKYYNPGNAVLSIAGDIDYTKTEELVRKYYGELKGNDKPLKEVSQADIISKEIRDIIFDNVQIPGVFMFFLLPKIGSKENYAMKALNSILSDGESSRLHKRLVYEKGIASEIDSAVYEMEDVSMLFISAYGYNEGNTQEIENQIDAVLDEVRRGEITDNELTKVKNKIETAFNSRRQTIIGLADKLSGIKTFFGDTNLINTEINFYLNITRDDLVNTSKNLLGRDQRLVLNYLPKQ